MDSTSHSAACSMKLDEKATKIKSTKEWVDHPLMVCDNNQKKLDISNEIRIENEYFSGKALLLINGLPHSSEYFIGKKRKFEYIIQGRFLKPLSFSEVYTGHAFLKPLAMHPPQWLTSALMPIINYFQPAAEVKLDGPSPYILSPIMSTMQAIVVSKLGDERSLSELLDCDDNLSLIDSQVFANMSSCKRKTYFSQQENLKKYSFDPNLIYSFAFYQHVLNIATFNLEMSVFQYDILKVIGCQPVQCLAVIWNPKNEVSSSKSNTKSATSSLKSNNTDVSSGVDNINSKLKIEGETKEGKTKKDTNTNNIISDGDEISSTAQQQQSSKSEVSTDSMDSYKTATSEAINKNGESSSTDSSYTSSSSFLTMPTTLSGSTPTSTISNNTSITTSGTTEKNSINTSNAATTTTTASGTKEWVYLYEIQVWHERSLR